MSIRIIADDLTGALDAAAPFARADAPVGVTWPGASLPDRRAIAISTESRAASPDEAVAATRHSFRRLQTHPGPVATLWFAKVDSVLRGHPFLVTATLMQELGNPYCVFAPAFPAMGRITRDGIHLVRIGADWIPTTASDIAGGLRAAGLAPVAVDGAADQTGVIVIDAAAQSDLDRAVARHRGNLRIGAPLWAGSRGLAEALAGDPAPLAPPPLAMIVVGTSHPVTRAQVTLAAPWCVRMPGDGPIRPADRQCLLFDAVDGSVGPADTQSAVRRAAARIDRESLTGRALFVTGGDTLTAVLSGIAAESLDCMGEVQPGVPVCTIRGGTLDGCSLVSKSGGFGESALLLRMLDRP